MQGVTSGLGIELVVGDLDRAIELLAGVVGCELLTRQPSQLVAGEMAVVDAGGFVISLLCPAASGEGAVLAERTPRISQIIFGSRDSGDVAAVREAAMDAGFALGDAGAPRFHITPESVEGALGMPVAIVLTTVDDP